MNKTQREDQRINIVKGHKNQHNTNSGIKKFKFAKLKVSNEGLILRNA
jgi:hypothetical protein